MTRVSVVIITRNEASNLPRCLESVRWADEIIVVDAGSTDGTREIADRFGARVHVEPWRGFGHAKQTGVDLATGDWVFSIDADEVVPPALAEEIRRVVSENNGHPAGYTVPRRTRFLGRWIRHCGWYPDRVLRLFRRERGRFDGAVVHERVVVDGPVGELTHDLLHYSYPDLETYFEKFNRYTTLGAEKAYANGERAGWSHLLVKPAVSFVKHYVLKRGFLDGLEGFVLSVLSAGAVFVKYAKLWHRHRQQEETSA